MSPLKQGIVAVGLLLVVALVVAVAFLHPGLTGRVVYTVDDVLAGVRRQPQAWVGRAVLVHGVPSGSGSYTYCTSTGAHNARTCGQPMWLYLGPAGVRNHGWATTPMIYNSWPHTTPPSIPGVPPRSPP